MLPLCDDPKRLGARIFVALRVDCSCCTFYRGVALGFVFALAIVLAFVGIQG